MGTKVRFAPSPTGYLHVGGLRTALYNYLHAKKIGGKLLLRIEDTDQMRKVENSTEKLISIFKRLNIHFDEGPESDGKNGPYFQSQRLSIYKQYIQILLDKGDAYLCFCSSERLEEVRQQQAESKKMIKYDRYCLKLDPEDAKEKMVNESYVIRMKVPSDDEIVFYDIVRDRVAINCKEIDDQILIKSDGYPTYHFANVVDDHLMGITHVMRGEEWLPSTPKHVILYRFFDWKIPIFIHLPLLLNPDKSKLSKRQGNISVENYLQKGFLPEALINYVALLGWHPQNEQEIFSQDELKKAFSIKRIQKSGAVFDRRKLEWVNSQYLMNMALDSIAKLAQPYYTDHGFDISNEKKYLLVVDYARHRANTLDDMPEKSQVFYDRTEIPLDNLNLVNNDNSQELLKAIHISLTGETSCDGNRFKAIIMETGNSLGMKGKDLFHPVRVALYRNPKGPDIPLIFSILGRNETLIRISKVIK